MPASSCTDAEELETHNPPILVDMMMKVNTNQTEAAEYPAVGGWNMSKLLLRGFNWYFFVCGTHPTIFCEVLLISRVRGGLLVSVAVVCRWKTGRHSGKQSITLTHIHSFTMISSLESTPPNVHVYSFTHWLCISCALKMITLIFNIMLTNRASTHSTKKV